MVAATSGLDSDMYAVGFRQRVNTAPTTGCATFLVVARTRYGTASTYAGSAACVRHRGADSGREMPQFTCPECTGDVPASVDFALPTTTSACAHERTDRGRVTRHAATPASESAS